MRSITWIEVLGASTDSIFIMWLVRCSIFPTLYHNAESVGNFLHRAQVLWLDCHVTGIMRHLSNLEITMSEPVSEFKSKSGLGRIMPAMFYAMAGLKSAWQNEHAFRQELVMVVIGAVIALVL